MSLGQKLLRTASSNSHTLVPRALYVGSSPMICLTTVLTPRCRGRSITTAPLLDFAQRHVSKGLNHLTEEVIVKGEGPWVTMHGGRRLLDFTSGIGVTNLGASRGLFSNHSRETDSQGKPGHCHPKVSKAAADQCLNLVHGQVRSFPSLHHSSPSEQCLV